MSAVRWPKSVVQLFHRATRYGKAENTHEAREALTRWRGTVLSRTGGVRGKTLLLNEGVREAWGRFAPGELVVFHDHEAESESFRRVLPSYQGPEYTFLQGLDRPRSLDVFTLVRTPEGFDLHLDGEALASLLRAPRRGSFRVAKLLPGRPVRVTLNGKWDFSMTGRRARNYVVLDYVFVYLGEVDEVEVRPAEAVEELKEVPLAEARHADLREILY